MSVLQKNKSVLFFSFKAIEGLNPQTVAPECKGLCLTINSKAKRMRGVEVM